MIVDIIVTNASVLTMDAARPRAEAVALGGGRIVAVGTAAEVAALATPGTKVIDAKGHHVLPGVLDVHVHLELPFMGAVSADDYRTGTRAGARGGVTTLIDFAIPYAGQSLNDAADNWMKKAEGKSLIDYTFHICITRWNEHKDQIREWSIAASPPSRNS